MRAYFHCVWPAALLLAAAWGTAQPHGTPTPPSPEAASKGFRLAPGLRIELAASDPQIESPVAMAFDERGRMWVVEMRDYPNGPAPGKGPEGRIRILEDRDGDGFFETSSVFAEGLLFANGILPWKDGAIVTAAPHIVHLRDVDGDGKADRRDVLYEGFAALNPQLRISHPTLGLDGWIYAANGLRGGAAVRAGKSGATPIPLGGMDFRFDPIGDRAEAISGMGQYGNTFDDWGHRFVCDNRNHLRHVVLADRYVRRNPVLAVPSVMEDVSELETGAAGSGAPIFPLSKNWTTSNLHAGRFTASCSVFIYRGTLLPESFRGAAFTCDPTGNLVHEEILTPKGGSYRSKPAYAGKEFLATADDWFRPVFLTHGPDGAIYLVDMVRAVIEHPEFMPPELRNRPDLTLGKEKGRIWRIVPEGHKTATPRPNLGAATTDELVRTLEHPEPWQRVTAQRLLLQRQDRAALAPLRQRLASPSPQARVHAAWLLRGFDGLDEAAVGRLLDDAHPRVREQAILLAEPMLPKSAAIQARLLRLADDADSQVRFQAALSLGEWDDDRILPALATIALRGGDDRWTRYAVASAVPKRAGRLLAAVAEKQDASLVLLQELAALIGSRRDADEIGDLVGRIARLAGAATDRRGFVLLAGLADGLSRRGGSLDASLAGMPASQAEAVQAVRAMLAAAANQASDARRPVPERLESLRLLAHAPPALAAKTLLHLVENDPNPEIKLRSVQTLSALPDPAIPEKLLGAWSTYGPGVRMEVANALLQRPERVRVLLDAIEKKRIEPRELDAGSVRRLTQGGPGELRERAVRLLAEAQPADRKKTIEEYRVALKMSGDPLRGKEVFRKTCAGCHRIGDVGQITGPDISDTRTRTAEQLLVDILDPNAAIDANYIAYLAATKSGKLLSGLVVSETASSVTLRRAEGQTDVILREDLEELRSTGKSLMPEGVEKDVTPAQMADLLSFLKNWRYLDGAVPVKP